MSEKREMREKNGTLRLTLAASVWDRAFEARIGITLAAKRPQELSS